MDPQPLAPSDADRPHPMSGSGLAVTPFLDTRTVGVGHFPLLLRSRRRPVIPR
jgi:hypothetical protein